ncbi:unnamed protein product [Rhizoctonia solani]|uniref:Uncharacterized protein n=1 Tax=Rhizoctonia solani TaxID=456999 RepID=A0A8H3DE14_9AGAM|nr:unnamed protein product [Rhizoctonia solani]
MPSSDRLDELADSLQRLVEMDTPGDQIRIKVAPILEELSAEVKIIESEIDSVEAELLKFKAQASQSVGEFDADLRKIEDWVVKQRRVAALMRRKTLACQLVLDGYPSEELLELFKLGRRS